MFLLMATLSTLGSLVGASFVVPGLPTGAYHRPGDIQLGGLFRVHDYSASQLCGPIHTQKQFQYHMAMVYAIEQVNRQPHILPNLTLGFAILDDCTKDQVALGRTMNFLEPVDTSCQNEEYGAKNLTWNREEGTTNKAVPMSATHYEVVGVVSGTNSQNTMMAAALLNLFQMPMVGTVSTSELLSNKASYKYFERVVPSDIFQAQVILDIITQFNWTYIIVINSEGSYGEMGGKAVQALAAQWGICVAYQREINKARGDIEYEDTAVAMSRYTNARVVVMFSQGSEARALMKAVQRLNPQPNYIWIASDGVSPDNDLVDLKDFALGSFFIDLYSTGAPGFADYFENLTPFNTDNPWMAELWQKNFGCDVSTMSKYKEISLAGGNTVANMSSDLCEHYRMGDMSDYSPYKKTALFSDSVLTFAYAIEACIEANCPNAYADKSLLRECLNGSKLLKFLQNVTFEGSYGVVQFDENGDADGKYVVKQIHKTDMMRVVDVGIWNKATLSLDLSDDLQWPDSDVVPESVCSKPCDNGQYRVQLDQKCCWECRECRSNEVTDGNQTKCHECPLLFWPNPEATECVFISPSHLRWSEPLAIVVTLLASAGLLNLMAVLLVYVRYRNERLIKATSRELSMMTLTGIFLSYIIVLPTISRPNTVSCYFSRLGFHISFAVIYAPLLAKTSRIFRIFSSAKRGLQHPSCISSGSQITLSVTLIAVQIMVSIVTTVLAPPRDLMRMPVRTERYVELLCDMPLTGMIPPLLWNLLLILCCCLYAFKARMLPDNFNESRYIFLSVSTTIFLWCAFLPTYFSAFYANQKALLLAAILLLNSTVMVICLYYPKVYAIFYVDDDDLNIQGTMSSTKPTYKAKVAPLPTLSEDRSEEAVQQGEGHNSHLVSANHM